MSMFRTYHRYMVSAIALLFLVPALASTGTPRDIVLLIDESGTDETRGDFVRPGIGELLHGLTGDVRVAALTFGQDTHAIAPLSPITEEHTRQIATYLRESSGTPLPANSALALERAIYELKNHARATAEKLIIVVGNGHIDTGDSLRDSELSAWTRGDLISEAQSQGIRVFWVVPSESADFALIQAVTHKSGGSYFRATTPEDFFSALARLVVMLATPAPATETQEAPAATPLSNDIGTWLEKPPRYALVIVAGAAILSIFFLAIAMRRGNRKDRAVSRNPAETPADDAPATLKDLSGFTGRTSHPLSTTLTKISRRPASDNTASHTIVIGDGAVSRNHALIEYRDGEHWISDMGSVNGTFVNNRRIDEETLLENGDLVRFARFEFEYLRTDRRSMGQTIFARARFLKNRRGKHAPAAVEPPSGVANVPAADAEPSETNKDVTLLRPKK